MVLVERKYRAMPLMKENSIRKQSNWQINLKARKYNTKGLEERWKYWPRSQKIRQGLEIRVGYFPFTPLDTLSALLCVLESLPLQGHLGDSVG